MHQKLIYKIRNFLLLQKWFVQNISKNFLTTEKKNIESGYDREAFFKVAFVECHFKETREAVKVLDWDTAEK